jgi:hypothetical protein
MPRSAEPLTPCDRPYPDCKLCGGTGTFDGDPCSVCVLQRWYDDEKARGNIRSLEEIEANRAADRGDE